MDAELLERVIALLRRVDTVGQFPGWCPACFEPAQLTGPGEFETKPVHKPNCELAAVLEELERQYLGPPRLVGQDLGHPG